MSFKKCKVVMLPTNEKAHFGDLFLNEYNHLEVFNRPFAIFDKEYIYITSDEEIKVGDSFLSDRRNSIYENNEVPVYELFKCTSIFNKWIGINNNKDLGLNPTWSKKVIATTNNDMSIFDLLLPQPSNQFIEKYIEEYNKGNVITDVLVEYEFDNEGHKDNPGWHNQKLKVNSKGNTITIKKVKDSWNREEVIELISDWTRMKSGLNINLPDNFDNWIETNL